MRTTFRRSAIAAAMLAAGLIAGAVVVDRLKPVPLWQPRSGARAWLDRVYSYDFDEPSLVFYTQRRGREITEPRAHRVMGSHVCRMASSSSPDRRLRRSSETAGPLALRAIATSRGWNVATGKRVELVALIPQADR